MSQDPVIQNVRAQLAGLDRGILDALNARIALVKGLKAHKEARGLAFHDPGQEEKVLDALRRANPGPLSDPGLEAIFRLILVWSKREAARPE